MSIHAVGRWRCCLCLGVLAPQADFSWIDPDYGELASQAGQLVRATGQEPRARHSVHARDDARVPFDQGRRLAAGIPGARFVSLPSGNHLILEDEPAFPRFLEEMRRFLAH